MEGNSLSRVLPLLWRTTERPSPGDRLSVTRIVEQAVEIADANGLQRVTMRAVAEGLSVGTMSLYTHVPGKPELHALMLDHVTAEDLQPASDSAEWRDALMEIARNDRQRYLRHPWLLDLTTTRPPSGPNVTAKYERDLSVWAGTSLSPGEIDAAVIMLDVFIQGSARSQAASEAADADGFSDADWWNAHRPYWSRIRDGERFPRLTAMIDDTGRSDPDHDHEFLFQFALDRFLDGIDVLLQRRSSHR